MEQADTNKRAINIVSRLMGIIGVNIILALLFRGEAFVATMILLGVLAYVAIPSLALSFIFQWVSKLRPTWPFLKLGQVCRMFGVWIFLCLPLIPLSWTIAGYRVSATQRYCVDLIPRLEQWRQQNGQYPARLEDIEEDGKPSIWLLGFGYESSGKDFSFTVRYPSSLVGVAFYDCELRQWYDD